MIKRLRPAGQAIMCSSNQQAKNRIPRAILSPYTTNSFPLFYLVFGFKLQMKPAYFTDRANITHPALHIRDTTDAYRVIQAVRLNILPIVKRRLASHERAQLTSGNVFVWTESRDGLLRWTEGRQWSESKTRGDCLIYEEKIETTEIEKRAKAARRAMRALDMPECITPPPKRKYRPSKVDGLTKHTYTVTVNSSSGTGKWHLVAYYSGAESHRLPVVEDYEYLRNIQIPIGVFGAHDEPLGINTPCSRPLCGASSPFTQRSVSPTTDDSEQQNPTSRLLSRNPHPAGLVLPPISPVLSPITLPPLSSLDIYCQKHRPAKLMQPRLGTLCYDDRRILDKLCVVNEVTGGSRAEHSGLVRR